MLANTFKRAFSTAMNPTSMLFRHQREISKYNALSTLMKPPKKIIETDLNQWSDIGLTEFFIDDLTQIKTYKADVQPKSKETNSPTGSWFKLFIPFGKSEKLRNEFQRFDSKSIRIGKILEILDLVAGGVSYDYCYQKPHGGYQTNVTACVDNFKFFDGLKYDQDMNLYAYVTYVGTSSIEIRLDMFQGPDESIYCGAVTYLFVARKYEDHSKAVKVPVLDVSQEEDAEKAKIRIGCRTAEIPKATFIRDIVLRMHSTHCEFRIRDLKLLPAPKKVLSCITCSGKREQTR